MSFAPQSRAQAVAPFSRASATARCRAFASTKKHTIDHTCFASTGFITGERASFA
jgi:hypothetical protein